MRLLQVLNPEGKYRVVVTKELPGERWKQVLALAGCRVEVCTAPEPILSTEQITSLIGDRCCAVIGQLTEVGAPASCSLEGAGLLL